MNRAGTLETNLLELHIETLFICDAQGDLRFVREPGYEESELDAAPRFFMGRSDTGNIWRFRYDLPEALRLELTALCQLEPRSASLHEEPLQAAQLRSALERHAAVTEEDRGPAYWIPESALDTRDAVLVTDENAHILEQNFGWKLTSSNSFRTGTLTASVLDESAVSICYCARLTDDAAEAGVDTVASARGRGHASRAVVLWASIIRAQGLTPLYSTSWDNTASQGVARKLGAVRYAETWSVA